MRTEAEHGIQLRKVKNYYDTAQKYYERVWYSGNRGLGLHYGIWADGVQNRIEAIEKENEILAHFAQIKQGDLVCDAGCGVGGSGIWLARHRGARVVALNIVRKQLREGQVLAERNAVTEPLNFIEADYHHIPFAPHSFDAFWSLESLEHSDDVGQFISEAYTLLKPGGIAVIAATFRGTKIPSEKQKQQLQVGFRAAGAFTDFHSDEEVADILIKSGFSTVKNICLTGHVMPSADEMEMMCQVGLPFAKLGHQMGLISQIMVDNTAWGTYQADLFRKNITSYHVLVAQK